MNRSATTKTTANNTIRLATGTGTRPSNSSGLTSTTGTPFPASGGAVPHGSPVRRQFLQEEAAAIARSMQHEGPPGPSSETVLRGLPSSSTSSSSSSTFPKIGGEGGGRSSSRHGGTVVSPAQLMEAQAHSLPVPARLRSPGPDGHLLPFAIAASFTNNNNNTAGAASYGRRSNTSLGGGASSVGGAANNSVAGNNNTNSSSLTPFEEEIFAIGRLNKVIPEGKDLSHTTTRSSSRMQGDGNSGVVASLYGSGGGSGVGGTTSRTTSPIPTLASGGAGALLSSYALPTAAAGGGSTSATTSKSASRLGNGNSSLAGGNNNNNNNNPWASATHAGKKGVSSRAAGGLRAVQPSPTFGEHDLTTEIVTAAAGGGGGGRGGGSPSLITAAEADAFAANATVGGGSSSSSSSSFLPSATATASFFYQEEAPAGEEDDHPNRTATAKPIHVPYAPDIRPQIGGMGSKFQQPRKGLVLQDYIMIAEACQRASRVRIEGAAYYKIGELYTRNKRDTLHKSIPYFKKYLNISRRLQDVQGEGKALNVLGCTYYMLMNHGRGGGGGGPADGYSTMGSTMMTTRGGGGGSGEDSEGSKILSMTKAELINTALEYHQEHATIADAAGLFIAQTNMGLCYAALGELGRASECYKTAMQLAVRSGDRVAEALALANLSRVGTLQGDVATAQVCVERNLEIAAATKDTKVGCESYEQLGTLSMLKGDYASATEAFLMGLEVALTEGDAEKASELRCKIGLVQGKMRLHEQMSQAIGRMTPHPK